MFPHDICRLSSFLESQYGESEEPMGDEDYDEYSKELNQYRRSKDGRGRGGQGAGAQEVMSRGWGALLLAAAGFGCWGEAAGECHLSPLQG